MPPKPAAADAVSPAARRDRAQTATHRARDFVVGGNMSGTMMVIALRVARPVTP